MMERNEWKSKIIQEDDSLGINKELQEKEYNFGEDVFKFGIYLNKETGWKNAEFRIRNKDGIYGIKKNIFKNIGRTYEEAKDIIDDSVGEVGRTYEKIDINRRDRKVVADYLHCVIRIKGKYRGLEDVLEMKCESYTNERIKIGQTEDISNMQYIDIPFLNKKARKYMISELNKADVFILEFERKDKLYNCVFLKDFEKENAEVFVYQFLDFLLKKGIIKNEIQKDISNNKKLHKKGVKCETGRV